MGFKKGNTLGKELAGKPKAKTQQWDNIVGWLVGDGGAKYQEALDLLSNDKEISKSRKEFLDHYETLLEFHQPKLARQEVKQDIKIESLVNEKQALNILNAISTRD